jgi:prolyl-tRNA synthetase
LKTNAGFVKAFWNGTPEDEVKLKEIQASVRCLLSNENGDKGRCIVSGQETTRKAILGKSY